MNVTFGKARLLAIAGVGLAIAVPAAAHAQGAVGTFREDRPNRAIFGGGYGTAEQSLIFTGAVGAGAGTSGDVASGPEGESPTRASSTFAQLSGGLEYTFQRERFGASAGLESAAHYTPGPERVTTSGTSGRAELTGDLTRRTRLRGSLAAALEPMSALSLLPGVAAGDAAGTPLDYGQGFSPDSYLRYQASAGVSQSLSSRVDFDVSYYRSYAQYTEDQANDGGGLLAGIHYRIGRGLAGQVGYGRDDVRIRGDEVEPARTLAGHRFNVGLDFQRTLSLSRRTMLAFNTGTVMFSEDGRRYYDVVGMAEVRREIGRTWFSSVGYSRDLTFVTVFARPTFIESVKGTLSGLVSRRVSLSGVASASRGKIGAGDDANGYSVYQGGGGLTVGLVRALGLGAHYSYFRYRFDQSLGLPDAIRQREMSGHSVRVGLTLFVPIYHRARRP